MAFGANSSLLRRRLPVTYFGHTNSIKMTKCKDPANEQNNTKLCAGSKRTNLRSKHADGNRKRAFCGSTSFARNEDQSNVEEKTLEKVKI